MKKLKYIIAFILIGLISYQPMNNFLLEKKRVEREKFISSYMDKNSFSYYEVKKISKKLRPDLKYYHDFLMTRDPSTNTIPYEKALDALEQSRVKRNSLSFFDRKTEINWTERGPSQQAGRTRAIMLDGNYSSNAKVWAAGVSGGLWYSTNISNTNHEWTKISDFWDNLAITAIASDPTDSNIIYVGTGEKIGMGNIGLGIWKTSDGGANWARLTSSEGLRYIDDMVVRNENGQGVVYAGGGRGLSEGAYEGINGLQRSTDGGSTWTEVLGEISDGSSHHVTALEIDSNNRLLVGTRVNTFGDGGGQIFYSDDGTTFTAMSTGAIGSFDRVFLDVQDSDPNILYAMMENASSGFITWIGKSSDGGANWTDLSIATDSDGNPFGDYQGSMAYWGHIGVDPNDGNTVYVGGGLHIYKSTDSGSSWTQMSNWFNTNTLPYVHADQHNHAFIDSDNILFTNDGGVFLTTDGGTTFTDKNNNMVTTQFYSTAIHPSSDYVIGGTQDNGTWRISTSGKQIGTEVVGGDGGFTHIDQSNSNYQFTATTYNRVYKSSNGGNSWSLYHDVQASDGTDAGFFINPSVLDANNKAFYASFDATTIFRQKDYTSLTAHDFINVNLGSLASAFKVSPHTDGVLFVGTAGGRVFKITDAHTSSYSVSEISPSSTSAYISSIDVGKDDNQILITLSNYGIESVYETVGGGGSNGWTAVEGDLPDMPIRWGVYNRNNFNQVALATEVGIWVSDDISASSPVWNPSNDGLANVRVDMLAMNASGQMSAGTFGRGLYTSPGFTSTAPFNAAFTPSKTSGVFPLTVDFSDRSTGSPTSWAWNFGDGNTSTDQSPTHTYNTSGQFNVSLSISDGTSSDTTTKNNVIWATAVQDTLWEEGFETNPFGWADGRRDVHAFGAINSNGDADEFGWWYYTAGYGAADNSHWMAGLGGAGAGAADDWLISPELWLRPGTDNLLTFYSNMNAGTETYDILISPSGGTVITDFTVTLASLTESSGSWTQQSYDLTQYAGTKIRVAMHITTAVQNYAFWDSFALSAGQLDTAGAPLAPQGVSAEAELVYDAQADSWGPSDDGVAIFWNRNGETDLASYNVYGSLTDNFTPGSGNLLGQGTLGNIDSEHFEPSASTTPWPDTTFIFRQTFGVDSLLHDGLTQGQQWYYKVGAVDNDGNETISNQVSYLLDSVGPTAGTFTINSIVDGSYLRSTSEVTVTAADWSDNTGINYYALGIGSSGDDTSADVVAYQNVGTSTLELTGLSLDDYTTYHVKLYAVDNSGNLSSLVINDFMTYNNLLGDYDADWDVDVEDLNAFVNAWPSAGVNTTVDIGPATGTSPYLSPSFDSLNDINDVSVFTRNWLWTKAQGKTSEPASQQKLNPINFPAELFGNQIKITLPDNITAGRFEILNEGNIYQFSVAKNNQSMIILENNDSLEESYEFEFGRLSQDEKELFIYIDGDVSITTVEVSYQLFSKDGAAGNGIMELGSPDEFKLYQNYPNPFSSQTTFQYDVAEATSVKIYIYNTLGQLVKTIDRGDNGVGTHTVEWDGKNDDGDTLSSGVYFYQLRTKDFNKTMKMLLVK